mmetsp:Transcript_32347/g.59676  ORF Transcript_32347/g.59676 Transcript_32347/m.59676 type:complete len:380 (+) Transcript_32347:69-1208(+)
MFVATGSLLLLALLAQTIENASPFAISSSNSPKRKKVSNQGKAAGGFAKKPDDTVPTSHTRDESPSTKNLINFLLQWKSEGLGPAEVGFDTSTGIRGMYATQPFKKNDIVCKIPSDVALALVDPSIDTGETMNIAYGAVNFLQWYQNNEQARGMWSAYLDTLPTTEAHFDPTPDFYSDEEIEQLEFPMIVNQAKERKKQIAALAESENIPFDELQFAAWLVASRSFAIKISVDDPLVRDGATSTSEKAIRVLLPFLDMINHSSDSANAELHLIDPEKDEAWFAIRAVRPIKKGKEITISYGASGVESSLGLLMNYGFVPDENRIDALLLRKGGENCIESLDGWSTTLEEDEAQLAQATGNMVNVLKLRKKLKLSYSSEE